VAHHVSECHAALGDWGGLAEWQAALRAYLPTYRAASAAASGADAGLTVSKSDAAAAAADALGEYLPTASLATLHAAHGLPPAFPSPDVMFMTLRFSPAHFFWAIMTPAARKSWVAASLKASCPRRGRCF